MESVEPERNRRAEPREAFAVFSGDNRGNVAHTQNVGSMYVSSVVFNIGGHLVSPPAATEEQLEALRRAHNRAIESLWGKSVGMAGLVFAATVALVSIIGPWTMGSTPPTDGKELAARLTLLVLCAIGAYWIVEIFAGGWWREQRDTLRDLRRQRAAIVRELMIRRLGREQ
jgi:hypothetical protein